MTSEYAVRHHSPPSALWSHCTLLHSVLTFITDIFNEENANSEQPAVMCCTEGPQGIYCTNK